MISTEKSFQVAQRNIQLYNQIMTDGGEDYQALAKTNLLYVQGEHWTDGELGDLGDRPALTANLLFNFVRTVNGLYDGSTASIKAKPREIEHDAERAVAVNAVLDYALDKGKYLDREQQMFLDGVIQNRGYVDVGIAFDDNFLGHVTYKHKDAMDILPYSSEKSPDPADWRGYLSLSWSSLDSIEESYGKAVRKKVEDSLAGPSRDWGDDGRGQTRNKFAGSDGTYSYEDFSYNTGDDDDPRWMVRIIERNEKLLQKRWILVDPVTGDTDMLPVGISTDDAEQRARDEQKQLVDKMVATIYQAVSAGDSVTLYEGFTSRPFFTICPFYPFFLSGVTPGPIDQAISMQDALNKLISQELHIVNGSANSGWDVEEGSLINMDVEDLEIVGSQTGLNIEYKRGSKKPEKRLPNDVPRGIDNLAQTARQLLTDILGLKDIDVSQISSSLALKDAMKRSALPFSHYFSALDRTRKMVGEKTLWFTSKYYTEPRRIAIKTPDDMGEQQSRMMDVNVSDETDITRGSYDIDIDATAAFESDDEVNFNTLKEIQATGAKVPPALMVQFSPIPDKAVVSLAIAEANKPSPEEQQMQQKMQQLEVMMKEAEVEKLKADTAHRYSEISRQNVQTAEMLAANPAMAVIAESIQKGAWTGSQDAAVAKAENAEQIAAQAQMKQQMMQMQQGGLQQPMPRQMPDGMPE